MLYVATGFEEDSMRSRGFMSDLCFGCFNRGRIFAAPGQAIAGCHLHLSASGRELSLMPMDE